MLLLHPAQHNEGRSFEIVSVVVSSNGRIYGRRITSVTSSWPSPFSVYSQALPFPFSLKQPWLKINQSRRIQECAVLFIVRENEWKQAMSHLWKKDYLGNVFLALTCSAFMRFLSQFVIFNIQGAIVSRGNTA